MSTKKNNKVRLVDIARETGFSIKTVSRVVNNQGDVSPKTRQAIMKVVNKYNYSPNPMAATLRTRRTRTIGLVVPDFTNEFFGEVGLAIEAALRAQSYSLIVSFSGNSHEGEVRALELLSSKYVDGILLASVGTTTDAINELLKEEMPLVVFDNEPPQVATNVVLHDNINGAYVLTRHLIDHNYRSIGCVAGLQHQSSGSERLEGFLKAMEDNRLEAPASHIIVEDWTSEGGYRAMNQLLGLPKSERPRAVFISNSIMALGCYKALIQAKVKIPEEMALVSFDNLSFMESLEPPITTLSSTGHSVGEQAAKLLLATLSNEDSPPVERITIQGTIIKRRSCGCA